jgi:hypothetical protein
VNAVGVIARRMGRGMVVSDGSSALAVMFTPVSTDIHSS